MMNIEFNYLYRDGANYKSHYAEIFTNREHLSLEYVDEVIRANLIEGQWFYAHKWMVKDLHFSHYDVELDHDWHEYAELENTEESTTKGDISEFLRLIKLHNSY